MKLRPGKRHKTKTATSQSPAPIHLKFQQALIWHQQGHLTQAQALYEELLKEQPKHFETLYSLGVIAAQTNNLPKAVELFTSAININPHNAGTYFNRGLALCELNQWEAALRDYDQSIALEGNSADVYFNRGNARKELQQLDAALTDYNAAIALDRGFSAAYNNRGLVLQELKQPDAALDSYNQAIALQPDYAGAYLNRGNTFTEQGRLEAAIDSYSKAISIAPDFAVAYNNLGNALKELQRRDAALASYDQAIALAPGYAEAHNNRGATLLELKQYAAALASFDRAVALAPGYAEAYYNRGNALHKLNQLPAAIASYDRAIALKPDYAEAYNNRGNPLYALKHLEAALASYDQAIAIRPDYAEAYCNRGNPLQELKQHQVAIESYNKALSIHPDHDFLYGVRLHIKMQICAWEDTENQLAELIRKIHRNEKATPPFPVLALSSSLPLQRQAAEISANANFPPNAALGEIAKYPRHEKIRIGYFSMDFRKHPLSQLMVKIFETHDRSEFEVIAFSFGPDTQDEMRKRLEGAFDQFIDVRDKSDQAIAEMARQLEIDLAIDLAGFTAGSRTGIFTFRAAPIQVSWLGYPGTMGAPYIDYLMADRIVVPEGQRQHYSEKIVSLPDSYWPNSYQDGGAGQQISGRVFTRQELGLPESGFIFCCFNNSYKITPETFASWLRILAKVAGSILWLFEDHPAATANLRREFAQRGMDPQRLAFARRMPLPEHLARHRAADLFIDTLPYNAHTTASDALWAGLPVLTCTGEAFASRVAASMLTAIDVPELITTSREEYEALAVELATNPERLKTLKQKLATNRLTKPLFDTRLYTRHVEDAFRQMYERYQANLPPDHIAVEAK